MKKLLLLILLIPNLLLAQYCTDAIVLINLDQYPSETSWEIADTNGTVLFSGGPYTVSYTHLTLPTKRIV